jgi:ABC-type Fe3+-hydroxamate transport system substrate-binding protein
MKIYKTIILTVFIIAGTEIFAQKRIVSLAPSLTKMIYLLEANNKLVGCTSYCEIAKSDKVSVVASAVEVNLEKVCILRPDLVIASSLTRPSTIEAIERLNIKVIVLPAPKSYNDICNQLIEIAKPLGKEALAKSIIDVQKTRLEKLKQSVPKNKKPKVFFEIGAKPLFTVIPNTFMNDYISLSGAENIASDLTSGTITRETVIARNPDVIFIVTMGIVGNEEKATWEKYYTINASKTGRIFIIDSNKACSPNPVNFVDVVEQIITLLYK